MLAGNEASRGAEQPRARKGERGEGQPRRVGREGATHQGLSKEVPGSGAPPSLPELSLRRLLGGRINSPYIHPGCGRAYGRSPPVCAIWTRRISRPNGNLVTLETGSLGGLEQVASRNVSQPRA